MTGVGTAGGPGVAHGLRVAGVALLAVPLLLVTGILVLLAPATPAAAHAALLAAAPAPGAVVGTSPTEVVVTFTESVRPVTDKVHVLAPDGSRISGTPTARGGVLHIPVRRADRPLGTYLVTYRVISADSHPVGGGLTFSVGAPSARPPQPPSDVVHPSVAVALPVVRYLGYAGLVLALGPALLLAFLWPRRVSRRGPVRLVRAGLGMVGLATLGALWTQGPYSSGAALWQVSGAGSAAVLGSTFGAALTSRLAVLAAVAALLPPVLHGRAGRGRAVLLVALAAVGLVTWPVAGHAAAAPLAPVAVAADVVHLAAMAVWVGGLITLAAFLLPATHPRVLGSILPVWSRWAALAVVWLVIGGTVQAVVQVGAVSSLATTGYGRLLLAKIAVVVLVLGTAVYARRLVRRAQTPAAGAGRLRRTVAVEVAATALVLGLSAVLVQTTPARIATAEEVATDTEGVSQTLTGPLYTLQFNIFPVQLGENNTVHAFVYTPQGSPLPAEEWSVTTQLTGQDTEPVRTRMLGLRPPHHAVGALTFPLPGVYELRFTVRVSDLDRATVRTTVTVR